MSDKRPEPSLQEDWGCTTVLYACYHDGVPTKHRRVSVTVDPPLSQALERARRCAAENGGEREIADATLVHDLAIRGVGALEEDEERRQRLLADLGDTNWLREHLNVEGLGEVLALREADPTAPNF